ncbi:inverse autotransporter beta domain-containing protein, partial [Salmonella enterica subsp. enterica serovar Newport]|nr:inverse autotransporter beta domain-containing protein [Salmonella enterica subsp. enterica serovar Newport]
MKQKYPATDCPTTAPLSAGVRYLAWLNIVMQAAFPLAVAFTPGMAGAAGDPPPQAEQTLPLTRVYTLSAGETVASVAEKYNTSLKVLRQLNALRTFAHGFDHLQPGDELDVPVSPQAPGKPDGKTLTGRERADDPAMKVASLASQTGGFLANHPDGEAAASMARGMAAGAAGEEVQQWLNQFGTARVQLDTDDHFSLKNSALDLLIPLYDRGENLVFTQGSLHRTDDRSQANLGTGFRHFMSGSMMGGNLFGDYDLSRGHVRMGTGVEYWRDFLRLSANGYLRLTGWRDSPDLVDYQERPANGWDIRTQAWLPSLPQLGGKLVYEQYYGSEVALFGVDNRQKNPHAITAGINYTPVPLLTLKAEQRQGKGGKNDTRFGLDITWRPGMSWRSQTDPSVVGAMRSLAGARYDLVERNNNIVLDYRKKNVIRLNMTRQVTGHSGEEKSLGVSVTSTHGLSHIDWSAPSLLAAGGKIVHKGGDYVVVLPEWQPAVNTYTVSGTAVDTKGNRSDRVETQVIVQAQAVNRINSTFTPANSSLPADGISRQVLTLVLKDEHNQPVDMRVSDILLDTGRQAGALVSALERKSAGVYTTVVTAGHYTETVTLTPQVGGVTLPPARVVITAGTPAEVNSAISRDRETYAPGDDMLIT